MCPQPERAALAAPQPEYDQQERSVLLRLAHSAIETALLGRKLDFTPPTPHLAELRGAFTTLHLEGNLRGCVGYVVPAYPLYRTVAETARAAAFNDSRFSPVTRGELPLLHIEISVLSPLRPITPEEVAVGQHGLVVSYAGWRGLLLPQVPVEHGWDRRTFIQQTCRKAGLPDDAWRHGATLEAFTAEVFGEQ